MFKLKWQRWLLLLLCVLFIFCLFTGCAQTQTGETSADTRTVTDQAGRKVEIPAEVNRIVTTWRPCTLVFGGGGGGKLVGGVVVSPPPFWVYLVFAVGGRKNGGGNGLGKKKKKKKNFFLKN